MLDRYDLGGVYEDIAEQLDEIVDQEREGIDRRVDEARQSGRQAPPGDRRRGRPRSGASSSTRCRPTSPGKVSELQHYDWMDDDARQQFEELMDSCASS